MCIYNISTFSFTVYHLFVPFLVRDGVEGVISIGAHLRWKGNIQVKFVSLWFRISYTLKRCTFILVLYIPFLHHILPGGLFSARVGA